MITVGTCARARLRVVVTQTTLEGTSFVLDGRDEIRLTLAGLHHATNAAIAFAVGRWFGLDPRSIAGRLATFDSEAGRSHVLHVGGACVVDDTYNANPQSMLAAVRTLAMHRYGRRVFVMGDMYELGREAPRWHDAVVRAAAEQGIEVLVAVGAESTWAVHRLRETSPGVMETHIAPDAEAACDCVRAIVGHGDAVWVKGSRMMGLERVVAELSRPLRSRRTGRAVSDAAA
jgi:UDP-N-acetylmuramoyl-tripeptide--D-alanyl-D-alanine ligase